MEAPKNEERKKGKGGKTVSSYFKGQLDDLMTTLYKTEPHFIRCVVPNTHKQPGGVEPGLVMHQYQCNGVLAGIAICRAGIPNKLAYPEFKARYNIIGASAVAKAKNDKAAAGAIMDIVKLDKEMALYACQRAIRSYMMAKTWLWLQLWLSIKPNLRCSQFGKFKKEYEDKIAEAEANIDGAVAARAKVQAVYDGFAAQKNELQLALNSGGSAVQDMIDKAVRIENQAADVQKDLDQTNARIKNEKAQ